MNTGGNGTSSISPVLLPFVLLGIMSCSLTAIAQVSGQPKGFSLSASLGEVRAAHTATRLTDGRVLVVGGGQGPDLIDGFWVVSGAELFDPATMSFAPAGASARDFHTATLFQDGRVLIAGGARPTGNGESLPFAELYDPATGAFSITGSMNAARYGHTATLLDDGRVLVTGGWSTGNLSALASAEIYDPAAGSFTSVGNMSFTRAFHAATILLNGQVLITGGGRSATAEVYDHSTDTFQSVGSMTAQRIWHTATRLADGTVLITGGWGFPGSLSSSEIYDPTSGVFTRGADANFDRVMHTATLLSDGSVLFIGGASVENNLHLNFVDSAEVFNAGHASGTISASPNPCTLSGSLCTSYITWTTSGVSNAQVWVGVGSGSEALFASAVSCSGTDCAAPWIQGGGSNYIFTLYDCSSIVCSDTSHANAPVLGSVCVTAQ